MNKDCGSVFVKESRELYLATFADGNTTYKGDMSNFFLPLLYSFFILFCRMFYLFVVFFILPDVVLFYPQRLLKMWSFPLFNLLCKQQKHFQQINKNLDSF